MHSPSFTLFLCFKSLFWEADLGFLPVLLSGAGLWVQLEDHSSKFLSVNNSIVFALLPQPEGSSCFLHLIPPWRLSIHFLFIRKFIELIVDSHAVFRDNTVKLLIHFVQFPPNGELLQNYSRILLPGHWHWHNPPFSLTLYSYLYWFVCLVLYIYHMCRFGKKTDRKHVSFEKQ